MRMDRDGAPWGEAGAAAPPEGEARRPTRRALLLQGPPGRFWPALGRALVAAGVETRRVRVCAADALFWPAAGLGLGPGARAIPVHDFRGGFADWPAWIESLIRANAITDVLYYADRQPYHRAAAEAARRCGARAWTIENGYLRPDWITMERDGMGAHSRFPTDPARIRALAARLQPRPLDMSLKHRQSFAAEAAAEVSFHLANALFSLPYPRYRAEFYYHPLAEYFSWARRLPGAARRARRAEAQAEALLGSGARWFLLALQLESDRQIRDNALFSGQREMLEELFDGFAAHAPRDARLAVKIHPHDNGLERWPREIARLAAARGLGGRVEVLEGGPLDRLIAGAAGVIATNSTVGLHAIRAGAPVLALGCALYDLPGLTHQGSVAGFWSAPTPPDPGFASAFLRALAGSIQVRGAFHCASGRQAATAEIAARIAAPSCPGDEAAEPFPPRLPMRRRAIRAAAR